MSKMDYRLTVKDGLRRAIIVLFLPCLHLITDQRSAQQTDSGANSRAGSGASGRATNNRAQPRSGKSSDRSAHFSGRERLGAAPD